MNKKKLYTAPEMEIENVMVEVALLTASTLPNENDGDDAPF